MQEAWGSRRGDEWADAEPALTAPHPAPPHPPTRLETDLADATHIYVASLCMGDELLDALWARLRSGSAPHLRVFASLREVRCTLHTVYTASTLQFSSAPQLHLSRPFAPASSYCITCYRCAPLRRALRLPRWR